MQTGKWEGSQNPFPFHLHCFTVEETEAQSEQASQGKLETKGKTRPQAPLMVGTCLGPWANPTEAQNSLERHIVLPFQATHGQGKEVILSS